MTWRDTASSDERARAQARHRPRFRRRARACSSRSRSGSRRIVRSEQSDNDDLRQALSDVQDARTRVRERQGEKGRDRPSLREDGARARRVPRADGAPAEARGHRFDAAAGRAARQAVRRARDRHPPEEDRACCRSRSFSRRIETSGYPVAATRLNIRKRSGENDSYDVEVGVSSYDRIECPPRRRRPGAQSREGATPQVREVRRTGRLPALLRRVPDASSRRSRSRTDG